MYQSAFLPQAIKKHRLSKHWLRNLIDAREDHLERRQFPSTEKLEKYSEKSNSTLYYLILQGLGMCHSCFFFICLLYFEICIKMGLVLLLIFIHFLLLHLL